MTVYKKLIRLITNFEKKTEFEEINKNTAYKGE